MDTLIFYFKCHQCHEELDESAFIKEIKGGEIAYKSRCRSCTQSRRKKSPQTSHWREYEAYAIKTHSLTHPDRHTVLWTDIPEDILFKSGWLIGSHEHRIRKVTRPTGINPYIDFGVDGMSWSLDGNSVHFIQAKRYTSKQVCAKDVGTFLACTASCRENSSQDVEGWLYYTGKLQEDLQRYKISYIHTILLEPDLDSLTGQGLDQSSETSLSDQRLDQNSEPLVLYPHQQEAVVKMREFITSDQDVGLLTFPPGTGKTMAVVEFLKECDIVVVFVPLITDVTQWTNVLKINKLKVLSVDSNSDATRDVPRISEFLLENSQAVLVSTFNSLDVVEQGIECVGSDSIITVIDEVHRVPDAVLEWCKKFPKTITMSGTPLDSQIEDWTCLGHLSMEQAIKEKFVVDIFPVVPLIPGYTDWTEICKPLYLSDLPNCDTEETNVTAEYWDPRCEFIMAGMLRFAKRKCIVYCRSIAECDYFRKKLVKFALNYHGEDVFSDIIVSETKERHSILSNFQTTEKRLAFLFSVRILDEGIDIPKCDSVYIAQPAETLDNMSHIRLYQRCCRANRIDKENPGKSAHVFIFIQNTEGAIEIFQRLKGENPNFVRNIRTISSSYDGFEKPESLAYEAQQLDSLTHYVEVRALTLEEMWEERLRQFKKYVEEKGGLPKRRDKYNGWKIGSWMGDQKKYRGRFPDRDKKLEEIPGWKWAERVTANPKSWDESYQDFKRYVEEKRRLPGWRDKYNGWKIGLWMTNQKKNKGNNLDRDKKLEEIPGWKWAERVTANPKSWDESYQDFKKYVDEKGRLPKYSEKYNGWLIGRWMGDQKSNKGRNKDRDKKLEEIPGWKWAKSWEEHYQDFKRYVEEKGGLPKRKDIYNDWTIGMWMDTQKKNKGRNKDRDKKLELIPGWKWAEKRVVKNKSA